MEVILFVCGGLVGWMTAHFYYRKATKDLKEELAKLKGEIQESIRPRTSLHDFQSMLDASNWRPERIGDATVTICEQDNSFQIVEGEGEYGERFSEEWTKNFPDQQHSHKVPVYLNIAGTKVKELTFVSLDGGRILVPLPQMRVEKGERRFFWLESSIDFKVGELIGRFYIHNNMYGVASFCKVAIERVSPELSNSC